MFRLFSDALVPSTRNIDQHSSKHTHMAVYTLCIDVLECSWRFPYSNSTILYKYRHIHSKKSIIFKRFVFSFFQKEIFVLKSFNSLILSFWFLILRFILQYYIVIRYIPVSHCNCMCLCVAMSLTGQ